MNNNADFLLEIGTEEIPAGYITGALNFMKKRLEDLLKDHNLQHGQLAVAATPRRLTIHVSDLLIKQPDQEKEIIGPPKAIAFDDSGNPTPAAMGFAKKNSVSVNEISIKETPKGEYLCIKKTIAGRLTKDILSEQVPDFIQSIPFPKTMRWGKEKIRFARPIRWIVCILGDQIVEFNLGNVKSSNVSYGHRFMAPDAISLKNASFDQYTSTLKNAYCIADIDQRKNQVLKEAQDAAVKGGGRLLEDNELTELNTFLTEYPSAVCGKFDEKFLELPAAVLITCMKEHQKYFAVVDEDGNLRANFVAINNTLSSKPNLVQKGHERVLSARLADADFFFKEDTKRPLEDFVPELAGMVFHKQLGSVADKCARLETLSEFICDLINFDDKDTVKRAAFLCKADLCTEMVGEFPTLQGIMGKEYALLSGEKDSVAQAIEEHYMPVRSGGKLPSSMPGIILSLADKIDNITSFFAVGQRPSGNQDPYALRRQAIGILSILLERELHINIQRLINKSIEILSSVLSEIPDNLSNDILSFIAGRFKNEMLSRGFEHGIIDAAMASDFSSPFDCYQRMLAIKKAQQQPEFASISLAFKRVMNILKGFTGPYEVKTNNFIEAEEEQLFKAYGEIKKDILPLLEHSGTSCPRADDYSQALIKLLGLKPYIDNFFDHVMVMVEDEDVRRNRLALLHEIAQLFLKIGDLGKCNVEVD